jgi:hypothetical protein
MQVAIVFARVWKNCAGDTLRRTMNTTDARKNNMRHTKVNCGCDDSDVSLRNFVFVKSEREGNHLFDGGKEPDSRDL